MFCVGIGLSPTVGCLTLQLVGDHTKYQAKRPPCRRCRETKVTIGRFSRGTGVVSGDHVAATETQIEGSKSRFGEWTEGME
jgi:hypothetical protein